MFYICRPKTQNYQFGDEAKNTNTEKQRDLKQLSSFRPASISLRKKTPDFQSGEVYKNPKSQRKNIFQKVYNNQDFIRVLGKKNKPVNFPYLVDIELTNNCNLRCLFCGQQAMTRKRGFITEKLFKKVASECAQHNTPIRLIRWGEPFLHPKIISFLKYAKNKKLPVHITSNGLLVDEQKMKEIINMEVDSLIFSMQGATKEEYQKMRNNPFYDRFKTNVNQLIKLRGIKEKPYIHISCTVTNETKTQIKKYLKYWGNIVDSVGIGKTNLSRFTPAQIKNFEIIGKLEELKKQEKIKKEYRPCTEVYQKLSVNFDGSVSACCGDYDNYLIVGNLNKQTLSQVWNKSEELKTYRFLLNKGCFRSLTLCSTCYHAYDDF